LGLISTHFISEIKTKKFRLHDESSGHGTSAVLADSFTNCDFLWENMPQSTKSSRKAARLRKTKAPTDAEASAASTPVTCELQQPCGFCACCDIFSGRIYRRDADIVALQRELAAALKACQQAEELAAKAKELYQKVRQEKNNQERRIMRLQESQAKPRKVSPTSNPTDVSRTTAWRKRKLAEAKLEEAATIAGGGFKEELLQMFKAQLREFGEEKEEEQAQAPAMETSLAGEPVSKEKVKTRLRTLVALRARLKCHISKETYYTLSSLAKDLPRFHLTAKEHKALKQEAASRYNLKQLGQSLRCSFCLLQRG